MVSDGHALSRLDICKAALPNKVYNGSSIPNFTGGTNSEANTEDGHLIDGKRQSYISQVLYSRVQKNWNEVFFKILEEPSTVQKKMTPHIKGLDFSQK